MSCHHRKPRAAAPATAPGILQPCAPNCACVACRSTWHRRKAVDRKEFFESTEFFARSHHKLRADGGGTLVDVAGGHGLVGVLAAIFMAERFERVIVRDMRRPAAFDEVLAAAVEAAPWVEGRVVYEEEKVGPHAPLPRGCARRRRRRRSCWRQRRRQRQRCWRPSWRRARAAPSPR